MESMTSNSCRSICLICTNADEAGAPRHVELLAKNLSSSWRLLVVFGEDGPVANRLRELGIMVLVVKYLRSSISPLRDIRAISAIFSIVKCHKPDIVHCHSTKAGLIGRIVCSLLSVRCVYTVHGWGWRGLGVFGRLSVLSLEWFMARIARCYFVFVADDVAREAHKKIFLGHDCGEVIRNGVAVPEKYSVRSERTTLRPVILMPARVAGAKDHATLLRAFSLLSETHDVELWLAGAGTEALDFSDFVLGIVGTEKFVNVKLLGQRSDILDLMFESDVIALISNFEALPVSLIEAMALQKPVIATEVGGVGELVHNGINGYLVKRQDVDDLFNSLVLLMDPAVRRDMGVRGFYIFNEQFSAPSMMAKLRDVYDRLVI